MSPNYSLPCIHSIIHVPNPSLYLGQFPPHREHLHPSFSHVWCGRQYAAPQVVLCAVGHASHQEMVRRENRSPLVLYSTQYHTQQLAGTILLIFTSSYMQSPHCNTGLIFCKGGFMLACQDICRNCEGHSTVTSQVCRNSGLQALDQPGCRGIAV